MEPSSSDLNFWNNDNVVQADPPRFDLPPLDSNNFFTSNNFKSSLPPGAEDSNRDPELRRHRVETDGVEELEHDNRTEGRSWRETQVDGDDDGTVEDDDNWRDSNRFPSEDNVVLSHSVYERFVVDADNDLNDSSDLKPINQHYQSRPVKDLGNDSLGAMSRPYLYHPHEALSQSLVTSEGTNSFSVPSTDSHKQLKDRVVRRVEADYPIFDHSLQLQTTNKPEIEVGTDERAHSQLSVITQETEDFASRSTPPSSTVHPNVAFRPPVIGTASHALHNNHVVANSTLSANMMSHSDPSISVRPPSPQGNVSLFGTSSIQPLGVAVGISQARLQKQLLSRDSAIGGSLLSEPQNRGVNSSPFSSISPPISPAAQFNNNSSQQVAPLRINVHPRKRVAADSPYPAIAQQLPDIVGPKQQLTSLTDIPQTPALPSLSSDYALSLGESDEFEQLMSLPSHINDRHGDPLLHYRHSHSLFGPSMNDQLSDLDQPRSLSLPPVRSLPAASGMNFFTQPSLLPSSTSKTISKADNLHLFEAEPTAGEGTYDAVKQVTEGSEEFKTPLDSLGREAKTPSLIKLVQQYLQEKSEGILACPSSLAMQQTFSSTPSASHQHDSDNLMKKELEKAFERISDLEVRVQDLTLQLTVELPDENEITLLSREKLQQEYKRLKELKRRAEQQNIEARMSSQRLIAENHHLKEELAQVKDDRQAILQQLLNLRKEIHSRQQDAGKKAQSMKLAVTLALTDGALAGSLSLHGVTAAVFPSMTITMDVFSSFIAGETSNYNSSLIITFGQAGEGKTSLLRAIDNLAGVPITPRGEQSSLQVYDILTSKDAISTETNWSPQPSQGYITKLFATMVAKSCSKKKRSPSFDVDENTEGRPAPLRTKVDFYKKKMYDSVKHLIEKMEDNSQLSDLQISTPSSLTFFDLGSDNAATVLLPHLVGQSRPPILLDAVKLEDVQSLREEGRFGSLNQEDEAYTSLTSEEMPLQLPSRLERTLEFAKSLQKQQRKSDSRHPITLIVACMYTDSFVQGKNVQNMVQKLKYHLVLAAAEKGITGNLDLYAVPVCQDDSYGYDNVSLLQLKRTIENATGSSRCVTGSNEVPARWILLQGVLQDLDKNQLSLAEVAHYGRECGIVLEEELHQFLALQHESGNILYLPHARSQLLRGVVITNVVRLLENVLRLFSYQRQLIEGVSNSSQTSLPPSGISDSTLRSVVQDDSDVIIHLLTEFRLCETDTYDVRQGKEKSYTLFPRLLRTMLIS